MLELYFLLYRIPKMMTRLARERNLSALKWTLIAIGAWIGAELFIGFVIGVVYEIGVLTLDWPRDSRGANVLTYVLALVAALASVTIVTRILTSKPALDKMAAPPPPPEFGLSILND